MAHMITAPVANILLYDVLVALGFTTSLNMVLDCADTRCMALSTSQTLVDITGGGNSLTRGATSGVEGSDPAFNGIAGAPNVGTYLSFDGGDFLKEASALSFTDPWHKASGKCTVMGLYWPSSSARARSAGILTNREASAATDGTMFLMGASTQHLSFTHSITNTTRETLSSSAALVLDAWNFFGYTWNDATATIGFQVNGTGESVVGTASTCTSNGGVVHVGCDSTEGDNLFISGDRFMAIGALSTNLSLANLNSIYQHLGPRANLP